MFHEDWWFYFSVNLHWNSQLVDSSLSVKYEKTAFYNSGLTIRNDKLDKKKKEVSE